MNTSKLQQSLAVSMIASLNEALTYDREAIQRIVMHQVPCNEAMVNHPTIQTINNMVGALGLINGMIGTILSGKHAGKGYITAVYDDNANLLEFVLTESLG